MCPITTAAKKALRQNPKRKARNLQRKKKIKSLLKQAQNLIAENKASEAKKLLPEIYKALDKAAKVNTIKKNAASRKKSRISALIKKSETKK